MPVARAYLEQLGLFQRNPDLLQAGAYNVRTKTNLEIMGVFVARLYDANAAISITNENAASLRELCREFGFSGLDNEFREMDAALDLPEAKREILRLRQRVDRQDAMIEELKRNLKVQDEAFRESLRACERRFMDALEDLRARLEAKHVSRDEFVAFGEELGKVRACVAEGKECARRRELEDYKVDIKRFEKEGDTFIDRTTGEKVWCERAYRYSDQAMNPDYGLLRQARELVKVQHPNVVEIVGFASDESEIRVFTKLLPNGTLADVLNHERVGDCPSWWNATTKSKCVFGIASAMRFIRSKGVCFDFLRPSMVFFTNMFEPCLGWFYLYEEEEQYSMSPECVLYLEELSLFEDEQEKAWRRTDVFSFGMTLFALFADPLKQLGFRREVRAIQLFKSIASGKRPERAEGISDFYWDLITRCWNPDGTSRPSFAEIVDILRKNTDKYAFPGADIAALSEYEARCLACTGG